MRPVVGDSKKILRVFTACQEVLTVILYGSRALGTYKTGSEIDLVLRGKDLNLTILNKIRTDLDDLLLPYTFDISIEHYIDNHALLDHIRSVGKFSFNELKYAILIPKITYLTLIWTRPLWRSRYMQVTALKNFTPGRQLPVPISPQPC